LDVKAVRRSVRAACGQGKGCGICAAAVPFSIAAIAASRSLLVAPAMCLASILGHCVIGVRGFNFIGKIYFYFYTR